MPAVALAALAPLVERVPALKKLLRTPSHIRAQKVGAALLEIAKGTGETAVEARVELKRLTQEAATSRGKAVYQAFWDRLPSNRRSLSGGGGASTASQRTTVKEALETELGITPTQLLQVAGRTGPAVNTARRVLTGYDASGRPRYRQVRPSGRATRSSIGRAGGKGAKLLGQTAVVIGAGIAAYLASAYVLSALAAKKTDAQKAGVAATLALRQARQDAEVDLGRKLTAAEVREMGAAWKAQLTEMGYSPTTFTLNRSRFDNWLSTYERGD